MFARAFHCKFLANEKLIAAFIVRHDRTEVCRYFPTPPFSEGKLYKCGNVNILETLAFSVLKYINVYVEKCSSSHFVTKSYSLITCITL